MVHQIAIINFHDVDGHANTPIYHFHTQYVCTSRRLTKTMQIDIVKNHFSSFSQIALKRGFKTEAMSTSLEIPLLGFFSSIHIYECCRSALGFLFSRFKIHLKHRPCQGFNVYASMYDC